MRAIFLSCFTPAAVKGIIAGSDRVAAVEKTMAAVGGTLVSLQFTRGAYDTVVIVDVPDQATAVGVAAAVLASGSIAKLELLEVLDMEPVLAAAGKAASAYKGPS
ncbi:GYD domain-containing protein [Tropicimonas sp. IMCC6043]|uniref:GYD domain-containing protein n=1 Tax=Tropicimonas sp. IMCC6043 TaxID=2510645 RepID=UPI00101B7D8A|nr:GYD domain-containing protein [Tropicimonas sp. IMCC6043]RYH09832.1 GYD domain-containing protein [Tropicimonas sp. IMCC6043]